MFIDFAANLCLALQRSAMWMSRIEPCISLRWSEEPMESGVYKHLVPPGLKNAQSPISRQIRQRSKGQPCD
jgi:hypothetical protein